MQLVGLGDILEALEKYIGKRPAQLLAILAALAFGAFCIASIFNVLLIPLFRSIVELFEGPSDLFQAAGRVIGNILWLVAVIAVTTNLANLISIANARKEIEASLDHSQELVESARSVRDDLKTAVEVASSQGARFRELTQGRIQIMKHEIFALESLIKLVENLTKIGSQVRSEKARSEIEAAIKHIKGHIPDRSDLKSLEATLIVPPPSSDHQSSSST